MKSLSLLILCTAVVASAAPAPAMFYVPAGRKFSLRMDKVSGVRVKAWWFNLRNGSTKDAGEFSNTGTREFTPPDYGEALDRVLVLDDAAKNRPAPGAKQ